jgi:hypothetical protein
MLRNTEPPAKHAGRLAFAHENGIVAPVEAVFCLVWSMSFSAGKLDFL